MTEEIDTFNFNKEMEGLAESIAFKFDRFLQLSTEHAELLSSPDDCVKPINDILSKLNKVAGQGLLKWKKSDVITLQSEYRVFLLKLKVRTIQKDVTNVELRLYQIFDGSFGTFLTTLLEDMRLMTAKRDAGPL